MHVKIICKWEDILRYMRNFTQVSLLVAMTVMIHGCGGGGGGTTPSGDSYLLTSASLAREGVTDFNITFDSGLNVTAISYSFNGNPLSFSGADITRSSGDIDDDSWFDVEIDWTGGNDLVFGGRINGSQDFVSGSVSYNISFGSDIAVGILDSATMTNQSDANNTTPPFNVMITNPLNGAAYTIVMPVTFTASAEDDIGVSKVEFYRDNVLRATDTTVPYRWSTQLTAASNGTYGVTARAYDASGNVTSSDPISITVNIPDGGGTPPPGDAWEITSSSLASSGVSDFFVTFDNSLNVTQISYVINGITRTFSGADFTRSSANVDVNDEVDVEIDWGDDNGLVFGGTLNAARAIVTGILSFSIVVDGNLEVGLDSGTMVKGSVGGGTPDTTDPTVSIVVSDTNVTAAGTVTVTATAADNVGVSRVEFYRNGVLRSTDTSAPYSWAPSITAASNGTYNISAKAYDAAGNVATSSSVSVTVNIPDSGGTTPPASGSWKLSSIEMAMQSVTDFFITFDDALNIIEISYTINGSARRYTGTDLVRSKADLAANNVDVDIEADWPVDSGLVFGGTLNANRDAASGFLALTIDDNSNFVVITDFVTLTKE